MGWPDTQDPPGTGACGLLSQHRRSSPSRVAPAAAGMVGLSLLTHWKFHHFLVDKLLLRELATSRRRVPRDLFMIAIGTIILFWVEFARGTSGAGGLLAKSASATSKRTASRRGLKRSRRPESASIRQAGPGNFLYPRARGSSLEEPQFGASEPEKNFGHGGNDCPPPRPLGDAGQQWGRCPGQPGPPGRGATLLQTIDEADSPRRLFGPDSGGEAIFPTPT